MSNITCQECGKEYDPALVVVTTPVPDRACFNCMSELTDDEIKAHMESRGISKPEHQFKE